MASAAALSELLAGINSGEIDVDIAQIFRDTLLNSSAETDEGVLSEYRQNLSQKLARFMRIEPGRLEPFSDEAVEALKPVHIVSRGADGEKAVWAASLDVFEAAKKLPGDSTMIGNAAIAALAKGGVQKVDSADGRQIEATPMRPRSGFWPKVGKCFAAAALATGMFLAASAAFSQTPSGAYPGKIMETIAFNVPVDGVKAERVQAIKAGVDDGWFNQAKSWEKFAGMMKDKPFLEQIGMVNLLWNKTAYKSDQANWGKSDHWASVSDFVKKGGDCEDYAIAKYASLRKLGFQAENMRIMGVIDSKTGQGHAILAVWHEGNAYILDNMTQKVFTADEIKGKYQPVFSMNENNCWIHIKGKPVKKDGQRLVAASDKSTGKPAMAKGGPGVKGRPVLDGKGAEKFMAENSGNSGSRYRSVRMR